MGKALYFCAKRVRRLQVQITIVPMPAPDTTQIWKHLGDRRLVAAEAFYADSALKEFHRAADGYIARTKNFRPPFVKRLPVAKRASYLATLPIPPDLMGQLIISYHFAHQRPLMASFLNALGIPNDNGLISEDIDSTPPTGEKLTEAVNSIKANYPPDDVYIYLATIHSQNPSAWQGLEPLLQQLQPA
jgi:hypothetical protein